MKQQFFAFLMMAAMVAASVNLTSCSKDDDDAETSKQSDLKGTWLCIDEPVRELDVALTFDGANNVIAHFEGLWASCEVNRTDSSMTMTGRQITMSSFTNYGSFIARYLPKEVSINFDYEITDKLMTITNVSIEPDFGIKLKHSYTLYYDQVYLGNWLIF